MSQKSGSNERYIFKSGVMDFLVLHLPIYSILLYFAIFRSRSGESWHETAVAFVALVFADNGHVYSTIWRTYFNPSEFQKNKFYIWFPAICFTAIIITTQFVLNLFWSFVIYFTIYHNLRQLYGFYRWYGAINNFKDKIMNFFFYAICLCPVLIVHVDKQKYLITFYGPNDIILFENLFLFRIFWSIYILLMCSFIGYVCYFKVKQKGIPNNQLFFMIASFILYNQAFLDGTTMIQIIGPLAFSHGIAYFGSIALCLEQIKGQSNKISKFGTILFNNGLVWTIFFICLTSLILGYSDQIYSDLVIDFGDDDPNFVESILVALWITPLFSHYYFDSKIWRHTNPDFKDLLNSYRIN
jgi:hypothetical protein